MNTHNDDIAATTRRIEQATDRALPPVPALPLRHKASRCAVALSSVGAIASALVVTGCGGGSSDPTPVVPVATTTAVVTRVVDGAIANALVCIDKNGNGQCDADETHGQTDAAGNVTLAVPNADVGKYRIVAMVGTDAVDADYGKVPFVYTMSTTADQTGVVSPLTTLVAQTVASTGASTAEAAKAVQDATGLSVSLFQDFTGAAPGTGVSAASIARLIVVATQQQQRNVAAAIGSTAIDGSTIGQSDLDTAIQKKVIELLPVLVGALNDPAVLAATSVASKDAALLAATTSLLASSGGLTPAAMPVVVGIDKQAGVVPPTTAPTAYIQLLTLSFTDASNYVARLLTGSLAQNTPDANNNARYVDRHLRSAGGNVARWGTGSDPTRNADLNWNGSVWASCPLNFENVSSVRDAKGFSTYVYCNNRESGRSTRSTFDIGGKSMASVYAQIVAAGYSNLNVADPAVFAAATFPANSSIFYQTTTPLTEAYSYYPSGAANPAGFSNVVSQYSAAVSAGGIAVDQPDGVGCNSVEANTGAVTSTTTLEGLVASKSGQPCIFPPGTFSYGGATYSSGDQNEWWTNSTVNLGKLGSVPLNSGKAPGFYSGNTLLRIAFKGTGTNAVTYYACKELFVSGSTRNCIAIGTGTYAIQVLGDARVMTFANPPGQATGLSYNRVFVERGGFVYFGYQNKPLATNAARLNSTAAGALLAQLGVPADNPSTPLTLAAGAYQGTWDVRSAEVTTPSPSVGTTVFIGANGSVSCFDRATSTSESCTVTVTDPATGAFTYTNGTTTATGNFDFIGGTVTGHFHDPSSTPSDGTFVGGRR